MASNRKKIPRKRGSWGSKGRYRNDYINQSDFTDINWDNILRYALEESGKQIKENAKYASHYYTRVEDGQTIRERISERTIVPLEVQVGGFYSPSCHAMAYGDWVYKSRECYPRYSGYNSGDPSLRDDECSYNHNPTVEEAENNPYIEGLIYETQWEQSVYVYSGNGEKRHEVKFTSPKGDKSYSWNVATTGIIDYITGTDVPCRYSTAHNVLIHSFEQLQDNFVIPLTEKSRIHVCYSLWNMRSLDRVQGGQSIGCLCGPTLSFYDPFLEIALFSYTSTTLRKTITNVEVVSLLVTENDIQVIDTPNAIIKAVENLEPEKDEFGLWTTIPYAEDRRYWHYNGGTTPWPKYPSNDYPEYSWLFEGPDWPFQEMIDWPLWANPEDWNNEDGDNDSFTHISSSPLIFHIIDNMRGLTTDGILRDDSYLMQSNDPDNPGLVEIVPIFNRIPFIAMIPWDVNRPSYFWTENGYFATVAEFWELPPGTEEVPSLAETKWLAGKRQLYLSDAQKANNPELAAEFEELLLPEDWEKMDQGVYGPVYDATYEDNGYLEIMKESLWALSPNRLMTEPLPEKLFFTSTFGLQSYCKKQAKALGYFAQA